MAGLGTIINVAAIIIGGLGGLVFGKLLTDRFQDTLIKALGVCTMFIGISGTMEKMLTISDGALTGGGSMMVIVSMTVGTVLGELLNLDDKLEKFGQWLKQKTGNGSDKSFVGGFVTTSLTVCIGAMAIVGAINDGILGDYSILVAKSALDLVLVMVMTASMGKGCIFSAIPVGILQGSVTILARIIEPLMTEGALHNLSMVGSMLIFCVGVNLIWERKIKVANMLPALVIAVVWALVG
ncbi:MAG: DUF554 domain-containing protein [Lachnospiraceae bacterium]|nr:DUF554 domain-containing protein [Lachnospiraceae bacterium]